jgi:hypothetical protein
MIFLDFSKEEKEMKTDRFYLGLCFILLGSILTNSTITRAETAPFYPPEETESTYQWNFDGFPEIYALNASHFDYSNFDDSTDIYVQNPTYSEFSVSYRTYNGYLEEGLDGMIRNQSHSFDYMPSFLINITTREYVNEQGEGSGGFANGYIDPRNLSIGTQVMIGFTPVNITLKETVKIAGDSREAWKLEFISVDMNQTYHYDLTTGILLDAKIETSIGVIGQAAHTETQTQETTTISHKQVLVSTNAWEQTKNTDLSVIVVFLGIFVVISTRKRSEL